MIITFSECVSGGLVIQHAKRMRRILLSSVASPAVPYFFPHYLINATIFGKTILNINVFRFSLQLLYETFLILRRIQRDVMVNIFGSAYKVPVIIVRF
jgi:hypothetical protein